MKTPRVFAITLWLAALLLGVALADRIARVKEAVASLPSLSESTAKLDRSSARLNDSVAAFASQMAQPIPAPSATAPDGGPVVKDTYTEAEYADQLATWIAQCQPDAMTRYIETVPFWIYGNPTFRFAIQWVMKQRTINGMLWIQAANPEEGTVHLYEWSPTTDRTATAWNERVSHAQPLLPPEGGLKGNALDDARDRLVRMGAACVKIFFDPSLLSAQRRGSRIVVRRAAL